MSPDLDPRDDLTDRLRSFGRHAVDPFVQSEHLTAMAGVRSGSSLRTALAGRLKVGAGVLAGFLLGATGLTTAGALGPFQPIAADVVEAATPLKDLPESASTKAKEAREKDKADHDAADKTSRLEDGSIGTQRLWDGCVAGADGKFAGNHGLYLKQERAKGAEALAAAKDSDCGMPVGGDDSGDGAEVDDLKAPEGPGPDDQGSPGKSGEDHGKPATTGRSGEANKGEESPGKSGDAGPPASVPAPVAENHADDGANLPTPPVTPDDHPSAEDA